MKEDKTVVKVRNREGGVHMLARVAREPSYSWAISWKRGPPASRLPSHPP